MIWFFIGDVIEWLESGRAISGVQRVALELLFAAAALARTDSTIRIGVCGFDPHRTELLGLPTDATLAYFRDFDTAAAPPAWWRKVLHPRPAKPARRAPPDATGAVVFGAQDHVLFLGLVWAPPFISLFRRLRTEGTRFSVLVYDLIQIQRLDLVDAATGIAFAAWLETVLRTADTIFVSSAITKRALLGWAETRNLGAMPAIGIVRFGMSHLVSKPGARPPQGVRRRDYVLSVGTVDRRKNQAMLFDIWRELIGDGGPHPMPQLVVVGRLDLPALDAATKTLIAQQHILLVQGATDVDVAALYANARFTVFPSLAEGYGLPVAESLRFGKVCIASDLPEIREFAGDLAWYFPAGSRDAAMTQIRRAIAFPDSVGAQERKIAAEFTPPLWRDAAQSVLDDVRPETGTDAPPPAARPRDPM